MSDATQVPVHKMSAKRLAAHQEMVKQYGREDWWVAYREQGQAAAAEAATLAAAAKAKADEDLQLAALLSPPTQGGTVC